MRIQNNPMAINAYNNLQGTQQAQGKSLERLSSGFRINRAADDAAGLVISESLRSQVGGFKVAKRNAQDAVSLVQTAEGALTEVHSMLQRMRDLSTQSANDTNNSKGRDAINAEIQELNTQIKNVLSGTEFNGKQLFVKAGQGNKAKFGNAALTQAMVDGAHASEVTTGSDGTKRVLTTVANAGGIADTAHDVDALTTTAVAATANMTKEQAVDFMKEKYGINVKTTTHDGNDAKGDTAIAIGDYVLEANNNNNAFTLRKATAASAANATITAAAVLEASDLTEGQENLIKAAQGATAGAAATVNFNYAPKDANATRPTEAISFQVGANNTGTDRLKIESSKLDLFSTVYDKLDELDVSDNDHARESIDKIDAMINSVSSVRGTLGATQNRLDHTINSIKVSVENLTASESRIRDTDMAEEMMSLSRAQILNQAGTSMLAQANQVPQGVLSLLR